MRQDLQKHAIPRDYENVYAFVYPMHKNKSLLHKKKKKK